jgi:hypothetical protein
MMPINFQGVCALIFQPLTSEMNMSKITLGAQLQQRLANVCPADSAARTQVVKEWIATLPDNEKTFFAINWAIPHSVFNVTCKFLSSTYLQGIDWFTIHRSRELGCYQHGGKVRAL